MSPVTLHSQCFLTSTITPSTQVPHITFWFIICFRIPKQSKFPSFPCPFQFLFMISLFPYPSLFSPFSTTCRSRNTLKNLRDPSLWLPTSNLLTLSQASSSPHSYSVICLIQEPLRPWPTWACAWGFHLSQLCWECSRVSRLKNTPSLPGLAVTLVLGGKQR